MKVQIISRIFLNSRVLTRLHNYQMRCRRALSEVESFFFNNVPTIFFYISYIHFSSGLISTSPFVFLFYFLSEINSFYPQHALSSATFISFSTILAHHDLYSVRLDCSLYLCNESVSYSDFFRILH